MYFLILLLTLGFGRGEKVKISDNIAGRVVECHHLELLDIRGKYQYVKVYKVAWFDSEGHRNTDLFYPWELERVDKVLLQP